MKKLLPKRKPERKPSEEEFALRKSKCVLALGGSVKDFFFEALWNKPFSATLKKTLCFT